MTGQKLSGSRVYSKYLEPRYWPKMLPMRMILQDLLSETLTICGLNRKFLHNIAAFMCHLYVKRLIGDSKRLKTAEEKIKKIMWSDTRKKESEILLVIISND